MSADFVQRGRLLIEQDQYQEAVKVCRLGLLAHPTELEGRLVLGAALMALRRYDEVLAEMRAALELQATHPRALALKAEALLSKGDALQATEILTQAWQFAPNDPIIQQLYAEAQQALASGAAAPPGSSPSAFDDRTSHYPLPGGAPGGAPGAEPVDRRTLPGKGLSQRAPGEEIPPPEVLAVGDRSGTMNLDPELDTEIVEEDPLAEPPGGPTSIEPPGRDLSRSIELDTGDIIAADESVSAPLPDPLDEAVVGFDAAHGHQSGQTVAYAGKRPEPREYESYPQPQHFSVDPEGPTEAVEALDHFAPLSPRGQGPPGSAMEFPADFPHGAPGPAYNPASEPGPPAEPAGWVDELFPEADDPSSLESPAVPYQGDGPGFGYGPGAGGYDYSPGGPGYGYGPGGGGGDPGGDAVNLGPPRAHSEDMRLIRAGLGMPDDSKSGSRGAQRQPPPASPGANPQVAFEPPPQQAPPRAMEPRPAKSRSDKQEKKRRRKRRRRGLPLVVYAIIALAVVGGAVYAGFMVRDARLDRQIVAAQKDARERELTDTFAGYLEAQDAHERIVSAKDTQETRAALARISAALAAEFGYQRKEAAERVKELGDLEVQDAAVARAYLALARHDAKRAAKLAAKVSKEYSEDRSADYLVGKAALLGGEGERSAKAFRRSLDDRARPAAFVGLAAAELSLGRTAEALAAVKQATDEETGLPGHPAAVILEARILAASSGSASESEAQEKALEALMKQAEKPIAEQSLGVSREQSAWAAVALAEVKLARGDRNAARRALKRAAKLDAGQNAGLSETLARLLVKVGDTKAAKKEAQHAAKRWPERTAAHVLLAEVALAEDSPERALMALKKAGELSGSAAALAIRGRAYLAANELDKASADLDAALKLEPGLRSAVIASAEVALRRGDARSALKKLEPLYGESAEPELVVTYASALRQSGERDKAREVLGRILTGAPTPSAYIALARIERDEGKYGEARAAYQKAIELSPGALQARLEAAQLTLDVGDALGARESLDALAADAPKAARVLVTAARVRTLTGDLEGALELLERAGELPAAPMWKIARERGRTLIFKGELDEAVKELNRAQSLEPSDGETRALLLDAYARQESVSDVRKVLGGITKEFRGTALLKISQGRVAFLDERFPDAISAFRETAKILVEQKAPPRELAEVDYWIGRCYLVLGDYGKAEQWLNEAVKKDQSNAEAYFWLGNLYYDTGVPKKAALSYNKAIEANPAVTSKAYFYGGVSYSDLGMKPKAKEMLERFLEIAPKDIDAPEARRILGEL